jgi:hypothetical protein
MRMDKNKAKKSPGNTLIRLTENFRLKVLFFSAKKT